MVLTERYVFGSPLLEISIVQRRLHEALTARRPGIAPAFQPQCGENISHLRLPSAHTSSPTPIVIDYLCFHLNADAVS